MKAQDFVTLYYPAAKRSEDNTGIDAVFSLAQAALESGWGERAPGFAFFGIKDADGLNGNEQLLATVEYNRNGHRTAVQVGLESIDRIEDKNGVFVYHGKAYFRKYDSADQSFKEHAELFFKHNNAGIQPYGPALPFKKDGEHFAKLIAPIYASGPAYANLVISIMNTIKRYL